MLKTTPSALIRFFLYSLFALSTFSIAGSSAAAMLMTLVLLYHIKLNPETLQFQHPLTTLLALWFLWEIFAAFFTPAVTDSLLHLRYQWRFLIPLVVWNAFPYVKNRKVLLIFGVFLMLISVYGIIQYYYGVDWLRPEGRKSITPYMPDNVTTGVFHAKGNFSHHLTYAHYLLLSFPVFVSLAVNRGQSLKFRLFTLVTACLTGLAILFSLGRSSWIGAIVALCILCLRLPKKIILLIAGVGVLAVVVLLPVAHLGDSFEKYQQPIESGLKARLDSMFVARLQSDRFAMWETGIMSIKDHFWFGIGWKNDTVVMDKYRQQITERNGHIFWNKASAGIHNIYLQMFVYLGFPGLLLYLGLWGCMFRWNYQNIRLSQPASLENGILWGMSAGWMGFMLAGFFENDFMDGETQTLLFMLWGWSLFLGSELRKKSQSLAENN
ncbi:MAG: O-antigen ligase family protein [SAR324 cluster bacterium]|nr:O-antigen ligase family protein [SAR324 cluster bacterium]